MAAEANTLQVQFTPAPAYLFEYLTADIQTSECIFDLIDNSIDSARSAMKSKNSVGLPDDYRGIKIELLLSPDSIIVADNCAGMSEATFTTLAFRSGVKSRHAYGIGHFGVGLKRALFKLGASCRVVTDDGNSKLTLEFSREQLEKENKLTLPAEKASSTKSTFTKIEITNIFADTKRDLDAVRWNQTLIDNIGRRYGLFIRKGLVIKVNNSKIKSFAPQPIENEYICLTKEKFVSHGVDVEIIAGVHEQYRFSENGKGLIGADQNNLIVHKQIAREFGWYVVCNDRVILLHDQTYKTGWTKNWHNEYNGFVGWLHFRCEDPSLLPWNTSKSDIHDNSAVYADVLGVLQQITQNYRQTTPLATRRRKKALQKGQAQTATQVAPATTTMPAPAKKPTTAKAVLAGMATKRQLKTIDTLLPVNVEFSSKQLRLAGLVDEAEKISIAEYPYASAILLRAIFDGALRDYLKRHSKFVEMRDFVIEKNLKENQTISSKERKNFAPSLNDLITWCINNTDVFPDPHARTCKLACENFSKHLKKLNGIAHEDGSISNATQVNVIRDDVLQGLLYILGS